MNSIFDLKLHRKILAIAIPMIISNITVPLLGLVDIAVIGHLEHSEYLSGVAVGGTMINILVLLFSFLRMASTGLTSQAFGANNTLLQSKILFQSVLIALVGSLIIILFSHPLCYIIFSFSNSTEIIKLYAESYFLIRISSFPAALFNLVLLGWLLGLQESKKAMWLVVTSNLVNIILDILFVPVLNMKIEGVAYASVFADYIGLILGIHFCYHIWLKNKLPKIKFVIDVIFENFKSIMTLKKDIFIRNFLLQCVFGFMVFKGASFNSHIAASNAILMNFLMSVSYVMDGFANAIESLVGYALGSQNKKILHASIKITIFWSFIISLLMTIVLKLQGENIIDNLTTIFEVRNEAKIYLPWLILFPLISMWSFLIDGLLIGYTRGKDMRNGMILSSIIFFIIYFLFNSYRNHALWGGILIFMASRWLILTYLITHSKEKLQLYNLK